MTAEIGVMNKKGIALAADSAVTIGNGAGYYNTANKLFALSKYKPVAIMIYNNSEFMECPMEIIIKEYRKKLKDSEYDSLEGYWKDFQQYLKEFSKEKGLCSDKKLINYLCDFLDFIDFRINTEINDYAESDDEQLNTAELQEQIEKIINDIIDESYDSFEEEDDDDEYAAIKDEIKSNIQDEIKDKIDLIIGKKLNESMVNKLIECCLMILTKKIVSSQYTGIVICGYGKNDIYPKIISNKFIGCYFNRIKKHKDNVVEINDDNEASIIPFAQCDVIHTFMNGIDSGYLEKIKEVISNSSIIEKLKEKIDITREIKELNEEIENEISDYSEVYHWGPMIKTVASAPKEELVQMAETLINLTSFRRKMIMDEYTQTVGGPIDVALITKGDGLIWIKRKNYFDKKLNYQFFHNYDK